MKFCGKCGVEIYTKDGDNKCPLCNSGKTKKDVAKANRQARHQAMIDLGLVRVKGAMDGIYYE